MASLSGSISIALRGLVAQQTALETSTNNIANSNTPGYARRRAVMMEDAPSFDGNVMVPRGVSVQSIESLRDRVLELRIQQETQQQSGTESYLSSMSGVDSIFSDTTSGIDSKLNALFSSLERLSTQPSDAALRQSVLTAASNLASSFRDTAQKLQSTKSNLEISVKQSVGEINELLKQVADVNVMVANKQAIGQDAGAFEDQRTLLLRKLSEQMDVQVVQTESGITVTAGNGAPLVVGGTAYELSTAVDSASGTNHVFSGTDDITAEISGGQLGGTLRARASIADLVGDIDELAAGVVSAFNAAHRAGFNADGITGADLFTTCGTTQGAASSMQLLISDPTAIAASADGTAGSNGNIATLLAVRNTAVVGSETPIDCYSRIAFKVGSSISNAQSDATAGSVILQQLDDQRGAVSGVSMDEEAANLIRFQRAYEAAARVINTINQLLDTAVNLGRA